MEALHTRLTSGEQSGDQEHCQPESPHRAPPKSPSQPSQQQQTDSPKPHGSLQQTKQSRRQNPERKRLRNQRQSIDSDSGLEHRHATTTDRKTIAVSSLSPGVPSSSAGDPSKSKPETQEGTPKQKRERKPQRPGKYVCTYCGRACAKPSVLQKHIRSHTGERPYPCAPCGFSFKTKSNLYKHRKSHTHRVKAGLALGEPRSAEEQVTESEDETRQLSSVSCHTEGTVASIRSPETERAKDCTAGNDGSYAVKKRLALRLSRGKQGPQELSDEKTSLTLGSKGSTESGYFSRSESTEHTQDSPPNTSAKSYAEIILGKYGRLGHLQRMCRHNQQPSGQEEKASRLQCPKSSEGVEAIRNSPPHEEYQLVPQKKPQHQSSKVATRKLVRQHSVQVPEILVTEDSNISTETSIESTATTKHLEKPDEFQWPQRSSSLAQLPIEKLPPKKKRLRLAEAAQSSGESSFDSISLPRSPSQDSSASYASSRSTSFEESNRLDMEITTTPLRRSRALHMLTVPRVHQHREMRRSASEQAPHDPQPSVLMAETRSKSFDYSCLSPERTAVGWRERRKCLLIRHTAVKDPEEEEEEQCTILNRSTEHVTTITSSQASLTSVYCSRSPTSPLSGDTVLQNPVRLQCQGMFTQWELSQNIQLTGSTELSLAHGPPVHPVKNEASNIHTGEPHPQAPQPCPTHGPSGAARAHYLPVPTGLKLEIPLHRDNCSDVRSSHSHSQHSVPHITSSMELLRPVTSPSVAVRLQTETLMPACAIYTTLSQSTSPRPQEAVDAVLHNLAIQAAEYRNQSNMSPDLNLWSDDGLRLTGSGGNKRMLSPSNSIELLPESQQQQKRVKEEEERNVECVEAVESQSCLPNVCTPITHVGPSYPSLLSSTCNSWCYLNYIKPNPSTLDEQKPSVYSSWSTSGYDPNPPGLCSKTALALLHCKQRLSPSIYTTSPMLVKTNESVEQEDNKRPSSAEVYNILPYCRDHDGIRKGQNSTNDSRSNTKEEEERKKEVKEVLLCSRNKQSHKVCLSDNRSNEEQSMVQGGDAGKCQCEGCESHFKDTSELHKCTYCSTESSSCKHCNVTFLGKGSLTEHLTAKRHGQETQIGEGVCDDPSVHPVKEKVHQYSDLGKSGDDADINAKDEDSSCVESHRSKVSESPHAAYSDSEKPQPGGHLMNSESSRSFPPTCKESGQKISSSARRALFSRRHLSASSVFARDPHSPSTQSLTRQRESPPPRSLSPRPHQSPAPSSSLSPSSCHVSASPLRPDSPITGLSPGPPGSLADTFDQCQNCPHPREPPSTSRLSVNEVGLTHIPPNPTRLRGAHNLLSHLPLHSQQLGRAPSQLIPIGGIHMIQPRSPLPFYSLVSSPTATTAKPSGAEASWRLSDPPKTRFSLLQRQDTLKEMTASGRASLPDPEELGVGSNQSDTPLRKKTQECFGVGQLSSPGTETRHPEVSTDVRERCVYSESTQGQKKAPSSQTQL
ncbi:hypothetical protein Q5P01_017984 [Channa striata]|uniref:C2H2-type domain-containing protein n=1 Tax=Channa striata TaxID=64152 RepID=A0AA88M716_CHASR|nr:hypothetical protein Q5P01_017984 [Channa striata]